MGVRIELTLIKWGRYTNTFKQASRNQNKQQGYIQVVLDFL